MVSITYTSVLSPERQPELEELLFFNPNQHRVRETIVSAIESYGIPRIAVESDRLRVQLDGGTEVQTLFAIANEARGERLAGVAVYTRADARTFLLLHLAIREEYSNHGSQAGQMLALRFLAELRKLTARVKGVEVLRVFYGRGATRDIPVQATPKALA